MKSASVIIPAWNEAQTLQSVVEALRDVDYNTSQCEVIVVAGGHDGTYELAEELAGGMGAFGAYIVIRQCAGGKNAAIQQGMKRATKEIIVLLDADTMVSREWLRNMTEPIKRGVCDLTIANPEPVIRTWVSDYYLINKLFFINQISTYPGHAMAFRQDLVKDRLDHFFDKEVKVGVDYLFAKRVRECGMVIRFVQEARVMTCIPSTLWYFLRTELRWLSAFIRIDGVRVGNFFRSGVVCGALVGGIPLCRWFFIAAVVFHLGFVAKKIGMCRAVSSQLPLRSTSVAGFILLCYFQHLVNLICYLRHFFGLSRKIHLSQGQRF